MAEAAEDPVHIFAHAALGVLRAAGRVADGAVRATVTPASGHPLSIAYRGPAPPDGVPEAVAGYQLVLEQGAGWTGAHRLRIEAPLPVFDLLWNDDEPVRILYFSRGDWEGDLLEAAR